MSVKTKQATVTWCITKSHDGWGEGNPHSRINWGQVEGQCGNEYTRNLDPDKIIDPVPWVAEYDGDGPAYEGLICREWAEGEEWQVFAPLDFATLDVGATILKIDGETI